MNRLVLEVSDRRQALLLSIGLVVTAVLLGLWVSGAGWMALLVAALAATGVVALLGGKYALAALLVWYCVLPTQFVPPLRFSLSGVTLDPIKVLVAACLLLAVGSRASRWQLERPGASSLAPTGWLVVAIAAAIGVSALSGGDRLDGIQWALHWATSGFAVALLVSMWSQRRGSAAVAWSLVGAAVLLGAFALLEAAMKVNPLMEGWLQLIYARDASFTIARSAAGAIPYKPSVAPYRALSMVGHPVFAAVAMAPGAAVAAGLAAIGSGWRRGVAALAAVVISLGVLVTGTRGSMLAVAVGILAVVVLVMRGRDIKGGTRAIVSIVAVAALVVGLMLSGAVPSVSGVYRLNEDVPQSESFAHRFVTGTAALRVALRHPIAGVGPGGFRRAYASEVSGSDPISSIEDPARFSVDDMYLLTAADLGLVALALLLALMAAMWRSLGSAEHGAIGVALRAGLVAVCVSWVFADALYVASAAIPFWVLLGVVGLTRSS